MKKTLIIALCSLAVMFAACKKPVEPTVDYTSNYVGNYIGQFTLSITSMNHTPISNLDFPIDGIKMNIAKGTEANAITATVTVDNESHQTTGIASADKVDFQPVLLNIDKPDQQYAFHLDLVLEGTKPTADSLNIIGSFSGNGRAVVPTPQGMQEVVCDEVSGTIGGRLLKQ